METGNWKTQDAINQYLYLITSSFLFGGWVLANRQNKGKQNKVSHWNTPFRNKITVYYKRDRQKFLSSLQKTVIWVMTTKLIGTNVNISYSKKDIQGNVFIHCEKVTDLPRHWENDFWVPASSEPGIGKNKQSADGEKAFLREPWTSLVVFSFEEGRFELVVSTTNWFCW